jgi:hypothetical protein
MRCVLWHAGGGELPGELLTSLSKRVGRMTICTSDYVALAESCLIERGRRLEIASGSRAPGGGVVVLVHPIQLRGVGRFMEAMQTHAPSMAVWIFDRNANPKLRAVVEDDVTAWLAGQPPTTDAAPVTSNGPVIQYARGATPPPPRAPQPAAAQPAPAPRPRLADTHNGNGSNGTNGATSSPRRTGSILTEEELRMLLSGDADPAPPAQPQAPLGPRRGPQSPNGRGGGYGA